MDKKLNDISISGSGKIAGGEYNSIRISGSGKVTGDVICESLHISGSGKTEGIEAGEIKASGSFHASGIVKAEIMHVSGSAHIDGAIEAGEIRISGAFHANSAVTGKTVRISGSMHADSGIEADNVIISGAARVDGLLNAETIEIHLNGTSNISEIGCERIAVKNSGNTGFSLFGLFKINSSRHTLTANSIEATEAYLENTKCKVVRAKKAIIGVGSEIDRVEYEETIEIHENAVVKEQIRI